MVAAPLGRHTLLEGKVVIVMSRTSAAVALSILPLSLIPDGGLTGSFMGLTTDFMGFVRGLSITTILALTAWMFWKFEIIGLVSVQEGTVAIRTSWGRPRFYRTNLHGRQGRLLVLHSGRHLLVKGLHGLVIVNLRDEPIEMPSRDMTYRGRTLEFKGITVSFKLIFEDSLLGDLRLINRVWFTADSNVRDGHTTNFHQKLVAVLEESFRKAIPVTAASEDLFPDFKLADIKEFAVASQKQVLADLVGGKALMKLGTTEFILPEITDLHIPPLAWTQAQTRADGEVAKGHILAKSNIDAARISAGITATPDEQAPRNQPTARLYSLPGGIDQPVDPA